MPIIEFTQIDGKSPNFDTRDFSDILPAISIDNQETELSGNAEPDCHTSD